MTDQSQVETVTQDDVGAMPAEVAQSDTPEQAGDEFALDDVDKRYFPPSDLKNAQILLPKIEVLKNNGVNVKTTFDREKDFPTGYGLAVIPLSERQVGANAGQGNKRTGIVLAAIPDPDLISQDDAGKQFIRDNTIAAFLSKVANAARPRPDGQIAATMPFTIKDFIEGGRRGESLKSYTELAGDFVKALRKKGLKFISPTILRQCLSNQAFAENQFSGIDQNSWVAVIDMMIGKATEKGLDVAIFDNWKLTREDQEINDLQDLDFSDLTV